MFNRMLIALVSSCLLLAAASTNTIGASRWRKAPITLTLSESLFSAQANIRSGSSVEEAAVQAAAVWQRACDIDLRLDRSNVRSVSPANRGDAVNLITIAATAENLALFDAGDIGTAAVTRVFRDRRGYIVEADIVLNPYAQFSSDGTYGTFDLQTVLSHEIGHLLGLRHSEIRGALMFPVIDRNTFGGISAEAGRNLSMADIASVRSLYPDRGETACCGSVAIRLTGSARALAGGTAWLTDASGKLIAATQIEGTRSAEIAGVPEGNYELYYDGPLGGASVGMAGSVEVRTGVSTAVQLRSLPPRRSVTVDLIGTNGVLGETAVGTVRNSALTMWISGQGLDATQVRFDFGTPYITVDGSFARNVDHSDVGGAVIVNITVAPDAPAGLYTLYVVPSDGSISAIPGALVVEPR